MSDVNVQTFSGKVNVANNLKVGSNHFFVDTQNNNVGIGTNNPAHTLDVEGTANVGVLTATLAGIGTDNPTHTLDVQGTANVGVLTATLAGIGTTSTPTKTLEVGSNLYVEDTGSNVLVVDGNVAATSITIGDVTIVASQGLNHVTNENNTTTQVVQFNHPTTGFVTTANVSVGRDALVTGNVTIGKDLTVSEEATFSGNVSIVKDLEVSGNVTNLDVISNVNLLHTANTSSLRVNSNVVTEFPRSKKLIKYPRVALTADAETGSGYKGYKIDKSSVYGSNPAWRAFDGEVIVNSWLSAENSYTQAGPATGASAVDTFEGINGSWLNIQLPNKIRLDYIIIKNRTSGTIRNAKVGILWAKNTTDLTWYRIHDFSGLDTGSGATNTIYVNETNVYDEYRLQVTEIEPYSDGAPYGILSIGEWKLYGIPEYDPEADGTDVVVKSIPNVPNTDWLEVYYDAKDLGDGAVTSVDDLTPSGTNDGTATNVTVSDGAFVFNGTSDIRSTVSTFTGDQPHTMSVWVNISTSHTLSDGYICVLAPSTGENQNQVSTIRYQNDGFNLQSWGNDIQMYNIGVEKGRWYHLVVVYDGGGVTTSSKRLYIDTVQNTIISGDTTTGDEIDFANTTLSLGSRVDGTSSHLTGSIANFRLFNRALTSDEIYQLYAYQKEYFGHGDLSMTLKAGRLGIGTSEPRAALDVMGAIKLAGKIESPFFKVFHVFNKQSALSTGWSTNYSGTVYAGSTVVVICNVTGYMASNGYGTWTLQYSTNGSTYTTLDTFKQYFNTTSDHEEQSRTFVWTPASTINFTNWEMTFSGITDSGDRLDLVLIALPV